MGGQTEKRFHTTHKGDRNRMKHFLATFSLLCVCLSPSSAEISDTQRVTLENQARKDAEKEGDDRKIGDFCGEVRLLQRSGNRVHGIVHNRRNEQAPHFPEATQSDLPIAHRLACRHRKSGNR